MANLNTSSFLGDILSLNGGYSFGNLYTLEFLTTNNKEVKESLASIKYRGDAFTLPERGVETIDLPWQGTHITIDTPVSNIPKKISFTILMDATFGIYSEFSDNLPIDRNGVINAKLSNTPYDIKITTYKSSGTSEMEESFYWIFKNCKIVKCGNLSFSYNSSGALSFPFDFIYETYDEAES